MCIFFLNVTCIDLVLKPAYYIIHSFTFYALKWVWLGRLAKWMLYKFVHKKGTGFQGVIIWNLFHFTSSNYLRT